MLPTSRGGPGLVYEQRQRAGSLQPPAPGLGRRGKPVGKAEVLPTKSAPDWQRCLRKHPRCPGQHGPQEIDTALWRPVLLTDDLSHNRVPAKHNWLCSSWGPHSRTRSKEESWGPGGVFLHVSTEITKPPLLSGGLSSPWHVRPLRQAAHLACYLSRRYRDVCPLGSPLYPGHMRPREYRIRGGMKEGRKEQINK